jgi:hypothetical protein
MKRAARVPCYIRAMSFEARIAALLLGTASPELPER